MYTTAYRDSPLIRYYIFVENDITFLVENENRKNKMLDTMEPHCAFKCLTLKPYFEWVLLVETHLD